MKRRKMDEHGGDLADVNEQELAKDGGAECDFGERDITGTETADGGSAPVCDENDDAGDANAEADKIPSSGDTEEILPTPVENVTEVVGRELPKADGEAREQEPPSEERKATEKKQKQTTKRPHKENKKSGRGYIAIIAACFLASMALLVFTYVGNRRDSESETEQTQSEASGNALINTQPPTSPIGGGEIYKAYASSTVTVVATGENGVSYGSGFCIFEGGFVATLYETVANAGSIEITLDDGSVFSAQTVGGNATVNLALLRTDAPTLACVGVGSTESLSAGSELYAIGSMGGGKYGASLVSCEVSYALRSPELMGFDGSLRRVSAIQISGDLDGTMRGCPVFTDSGDAVAILLSIGDGVNFALPLDGAAEVLGAFRDGKEPSAEVLYALAYIPPVLGILGEQAETDGICGVAVMGFDDENSDAAAKLRTGDIIFRINDTLTPDTVSLAEEIEKHRPGENVEIYVYRNGQRLSFYVILSEG